MPPYTAVALQIGVRSIAGITDVIAARDAIRSALERLAAQVAATLAFVGPSLRLVVLPEYFLTGYPQGGGIPAWRQLAGIDPDGPEYERLGRIAQENRVFLAGNLYETDPHFPDFYFQTCFIASETGDIILRYRRLISQFGPTPHDVLDRYLDIYGEDSLFPVVSTPLGRLAALASEEILFPEISRALALKGAEVLCHSSSEIASPELTPKNVAKLARAHENHCFLVSANTAGVAGIDLPNLSVDGGSKVVDYQGRVLAAAAGGESMAASADLHLDALRAWRRRPGLFNLFSRQRLDLFTRALGDAAIHPPNSLIGADGEIRIPDRSHFLAMQEGAIQRLIKSDII